MPPARNILLTGATGLVGSALAPRLEEEGFHVVALGRVPAKNGLVWDAESGSPPPAEALRDLHAVVNLAGAPVAVRWTEERKRVIRASRILGTLAIAEALAALPENERPAVLVNASGISVYGLRRRETRLTENSPSVTGDAFLPAVARDWEAAADPAKQAGIRTVLLRTATVLSPRGGALQKLLPIFRSGLGGPIGDGKQRVAWITLEDLVSLIVFAIRTPEVSGPVNAVAPEIVTNAVFARALGAAVGKPARLPAPEIAVRLAYGRMAEETILSDIAPYPEKALKNGFKFAHPRLVEALESLKLR